MTNEEYQEMLDAMERRHQRLLADPEAAKKLLIELGLWQIAVPIKSAKKSTKPSHHAARKK